MTKPTHGGPRKNAGRKKGSVKGRTAISKTIAMHPDSWKKLDRDRGAQSRGKYIETKLYGGKGPEYEVVMDHTANSVHLIRV